MPVLVIYVLVIYVVTEFYLHLTLSSKASSKASGLTYQPSSWCVFVSLHEKAKNDSLFYRKTIFSISENKRKKRKSEEIFLFMAVIFLGALKIFPRINVSNNLVNTECVILINNVKSSLGVHTLCLQMFSETYHIIQSRYKPFWMSSFSLPHLFTHKVAFTILFSACSVLVNNIYEASEYEFWPYTLK